MNIRPPFIALLGLLFLGTLPAFAGVPVSDDLVIRGNTVLAPGTYTVDDVHGDGVIQIAADHVTLDGTGVVIQGTSFRGVAIRMNGHSGLTLRNFTIRGFDYGISIENAANVLLEGNDVSGNRKDTTTEFLDIGCGGCYGGGILLRNVRGSRVRDNTLTDESTGLEVIGGTRNTIARNLFSQGPEGNESRQDSAWGLRLDGSTENVVRGNVADYVDRERYGLSSGDSAGFLLVSGADRNQIVGNSFTHSGDGFFLGNSCARQSDENYVANNDGSFSPHNAFEATFSSGNVFDRNRANHSDYGFWLGYSHDSRVTGNEIAGNATAGIAIEHGHGNEIDHDAVTHNGQFGIRLWAADTACPWPECGGSCPSAAYRIHDNTVTLNGIGISIDDTAGATATRNRLVDNSFITFRVGGRSPRTIVNNNDLTCHPAGATPCLYRFSNEMSSLGVDAASNYWGTTNAATIPSLIFDHADEASLGTVTFLPILRRPVSPGKDAE